MNRREFLKLGAGSLSSLMFRKSLFAEDTPSMIIKPSLEEIARLMEEDPNGISKLAIERGDIKKFEYTRNTKPEEFYKFLRKNFTEQAILLHLETDKDTEIKNRWGEESTFEREGSSGAAITFSFVCKNLRGINRVGLLYLELKDFYGEENWVRLRKLFNTNRMEFPSYAEFVRDSTGNYRFSDIAGCGVKSPEKIWENIESYVEHYSKK